MTNCLHSRTPLSHEETESEVGPLCRRADSFTRALPSRSPDHPPSTPHVVLTLAPHSPLPGSRARDSPVACADITEGRPQRNGFLSPSRGAVSRKERLCGRPQPPRSLSSQRGNDSRSKGPNPLQSTASASHRARHGFQLRALCTDRVGNNGGNVRVFRGRRHRIRNCGGQRVRLVGLRAGISDSRSRRGRGRRPVVRGLPGNRPTRSLPCDSCSGIDLCTCRPGAGQRNGFAGGPARCPRPAARSDDPRGPLRGVDRVVLSHVPPFMLERVLGGTPVATASPGPGNLRRGFDTLGSEIQCIATVSPSSASFSLPA